MCVNDVFGSSGIYHSSLNQNVIESDLEQACPRLSGVTVAEGSLLESFWPRGPFSCGVPEIIENYKLLLMNAWTQDGAQGCNIFGKSWSALLVVLICSMYAQMCLL